MDDSSKASAAVTDIADPDTNERCRLVADPTGGNGG